MQKVSDSAEASVAYYPRGLGRPDRLSPVKKYSRNPTSGSSWMLQVCLRHAARVFLRCANDLVPGFTGIFSNCCYPCLEMMKKLSTSRPCFNGPGRMGNHKLNFDTEANPFSRFPAQCMEKFTVVEDRLLPLKYLETPNPKEERENPASLSFRRHLRRTSWGRGNCGAERGQRCCG